MAWNDTDKLKERFSFLCSAKYDDMSATDDPRVQHCAKCDTRVYDAASEAEFDSHARQGRCVSVVSQSGARLVAAPDDPDDGEPPPPMVGQVEPPEPPPAAPEVVKGMGMLSEAETESDLRIGGFVLPPEPPPPLQRTTGKVKAPEFTPMARLKRWWRGLGSGD